jgi:molecular chaperone Hsp33
VSFDETAAAWRAAAVIVQAMPGEGATAAGEREDDWRRTMLLLETLSDDELLDPGLSPDTLLFRLFHEDGVRVFDSVDLSFGCSCDEERVAAMLKRFERDEVLAMQDASGNVTVTCEFCSRVYRFAPNDIMALFEESLH